MNGNKEIVMTESGVHEKETPTFYYFMGVLWRGYCGACGRMLFTGGANASALRKQLKVCPWCDIPVKIPDDLQDRRKF